MQTMDHSYFAGEIQNGTAILENSLGTLKTKSATTVCLGICTTRNLSQRNEDVCLLKHSSYVRNSPDLETIQASFNR